MMHSAELQRVGKSVAIGGLDWRGITKEKTVSKWVREHRQQAEFGYFALTLAGDGNGAIGLYGAVLDEDNKPAKGAFSAAAAFASLVGSEDKTAALMLGLPSTSDAGDRVYVVVLEDGVPISDLITDQLSADRLIGDDRQVYSDLTGVGTVPASFDWLAEACDKAAFRAVPINLLVVVLAALVVLGLAGGYVFLAHKKRVAQEQADARAAAEADPSPRYLAALAAQLGGVSVKRGDLLGAAAKVFEQPTVARGWALASVECAPEIGGCRSKWERKGGTFQSLRDALPGAELVLDSTGPGVTDYERVWTRTPLTLTRSELLPPQGDSLGRAAELSPRVGELVQTWRTAKMTVEVGPAKLWPVVEGVPPTFQNPGAMVQAEITVSQIPGPFLAELLTQAPWFIAWSSVGVTVSEGGEPAARVKFSLKGHVYAKQ